MYYLQTKIARTKNQDEEKYYAEIDDAIDMMFTDKQPPDGMRWLLYDNNRRKITTLMFDHEV